MDIKKLKHEQMLNAEKLIVNSLNEKLLISDKKTDQNNLRDYNSDSLPLTRSFIIQTAKDYDMDVNEVEKIYKDYSGYTFYLKLEEFIEQRSKK